MTRIRAYSKLMLVPAVALAAACGRSDEPRVDDALRNDLALATQAQQYRPQQFVSPVEQGYGAYAGQPMPGMPPGYAPQPTYAGYAAGPYYAVQPAPAPAPRVVERVVYRERSSGTASRGSSCGGYSTAGVYQPAPRQTVKKNTKRDAAIGAVAGAAIGVATSGRKDRLKGGLLGAVAGGALGAVIGNNVDVQRTP